MLYLTSKDSGWFLCKVIKFKIFNEITYEGKLLYRDCDCWKEHPSYVTTVPEKDVVSWMKIPDSYFEKVIVD